jgi:hypothetical protein
MTRVIAWPPIAVEASMWTTYAPVRRSRTVFSGERFVASTGPARIRAGFDLLARNCREDGAGTAETLIRLLDGGVNLLRVPSPAVGTQTIAALNRAPGGTYTRRLSPGVWLNHNWQGTVTTSGVFDALAFTGLPANRLLVRSGEVVRSLHATSGDSQGTARAIRTTFTNGSGAATVAIDAPLPAGVISFGDFEERVFEMEGPPPEVWSARTGGWSYRFTMTEVFAEEIPSGATEVNPWT